MQEYLRGWTLADFDALQDVGGMMERVIRSFAASGDIAETDLVSRVFGSQRAISRAIREFRELGQVSEGTFGAIADAAGPAGTEVAELVRRYFDLQRASKGVVDAQNELNSVTDKYTRALNPVNTQLDAVRRKQREISENQELEELGKTIADPRADADERQLARLRAEEIQLERQANALENERDTAVDGAQAKIDIAKKEEAAQQQKYQLAQQALEQQTKTNSLIAEETALRQQLIEKGLAEEKRILTELDAERRKAAAETERIADAQLRYNLASTDTAGQLAIMQTELGKVAAGSAEYFDILTQIISLTERLKKEQEGTGGGLLGPLDAIVGDPAEMEEASEGIKALSAALDEAFKVLAGSGGREVELAPAWQGFADTLGNIGQAAQGVIPFIQSLIDFVSGKGGDVPTADILRPTGDNIFSQIYTLVTTAITNLRLLGEGDWRTVWARYRVIAEEEMKKDLLAGEEDGAWLWEQMIEIGDLVTALGEGDWKKAWEIFTEPPRELLQSIIDKINELLALIPTLDEVMKGLGFPTNPFAPDGTPSRPPTPPGGWPKGELPPLEYNSFPGGIAPQTPLLAGASSTSTAGDTITYFIEQHIAANSDFGGARQGAEAGIREALLQRRLSGT